MSTVTEKCNVLMEDLRKGRRNITTKGGTVSATAGFGEVMDEILNISSASNVGTVIDNSVAFRKSVPANSVDHCYLNSIGGMTYKIPDTFIATVTGADDYGLLWEAEFEYIPSIPFKIPTPVDVEYGGWVFECPVDGYDNLALNTGGCQLTINGTIECDRMNIPTDVLITSIRGTLTDSSMMVSGFTVGQELVCTPRFLDWSGTSDAGYFDPPAPLRDAKVTAIKSYKANGTLLAEYTLPTAITDKLGKGYDADLFDEYSFVTGEAVTKLGTGELKSVVVDAYNSIRTTFYSNDLASGLHSARTAAEVTYIKIPIFESGVSIGQINSNPAWTNVAAIYSGQIYLYPAKALFGTTATAFNEMLSAKPLPYVAELENYITTPITTDFNPLIEVEGGGCLEFVNEYGQPVPSTVTFQTIN